MSSLLYVAPDDWYLFTHRYEVLLGAVNSGYRVTVLTAISISEAHRPPGLSSICFKSLPKRSNTLRGTIRKMFIIAREIITSQPSVVHLITLRSIVLASPLFLFSKKKFILSVAGVGGMHSGSLIKANLIRGFFYYLRYSTKKKNFTYIFQNTLDRTLLLGSDEGHNCRLIRGAGVDVKEFRFDENELTSRRRVLFAGRLLKSKGVREFLDVASALSEMPFFSPTLAGRLDISADDSLSEAEVSEMSRGVNVEVIINSSEVPRLMREAMFFVLLTSYSEGLPKAVLEAMASGAIVISTPWPDITDVIENNVSGCIVTATDEDLVTPVIREIKRISSDDELQKKMALAARERAEKLFTVDRVVLAHMEVYQQVETLHGRL